MAAHSRLVTAGHVGRPHGLDGSFVVRAPKHPLPVGVTVRVAGGERRVERRAGTDARPLVRLEGIEDRDAAGRLTGETLLVAAAAEAPIGEREWLAADLVGCEVAGVGRVVRVVAAPTCDVLELDGGALVPLVGDAVRSVDVQARRIEVDRGFLGLDPEVER